jgi:hypothetical protein
MLALEQGDFIADRGDWMGYVGVATALCWVRFVFR